MSIFGTKKKESNAKSAKPAVSKTTKTDMTVVVTGISRSGASASTSTIIRPRITEKSGMLSQNGTYTFEVSKKANKNSISNAIVSLYKVRPIKVSVINSPSKNVFVRGRKGVVSGVRKALVTLKKGDKIDFV